MDVTAKYELIGLMAYPIRHSLSPEMQNKALFHSISCPFRAGSDLVDRLRCLSGVRHGGDFATGG